MLNKNTVAVVVPAYNEELQISHVITSMPKYVDRIVVVNDFSKDKTSEVVLKHIKNDGPSEIKLEKFPNKPVKNRFNEAEMFLQKKNEEEIKFYTSSEVVNSTPDTDRIILINHLKNGGVGAAISSGYKWCKDHEIDCVAVMAGDGQMDPDELKSICLPVIEENIDYVKGNRLRHATSWEIIPKVRFFGNAILSILTKLASGYWRVSDTQTGYTAISKRALKLVKIYNIYKSYGMPNDLLVKLNIASCTLKEVDIKPIYRVGEKSKMKIFNVIPRITFLLTKSFFKRLWIKYLFKDFHPLFLFYNASFILGLFSLYYLFKIIKAFLYGLTISYEPLLAFLFLFIAGFQSLTFAMWMDILDNERLYK